MLEIVQITPNDDVRPCNDDRIYPMWPQLNCNMRIRYAGKIIIVPGLQLDRLWGDRHTAKVE